MALKNQALFSHCFAVSAFLMCCEASRGTNSLYKLTIDPQLADKKGVGDALMTYYDVTEVTCAIRCSNERACGFFFYSEGRRECVTSSFPASLSLVSETGWKLFTLREDIMAQEFDSANICSNTTTEACWQRHDGTDATHVSVGPAGVWGITLNKSIFHRVGTYQASQSSGSYFSQVTGLLDMIDVGTDSAWGVNGDNLYWYWGGMSTSIPVGNNWTLPEQAAKLMWISASPAGSVWGIDPFGNLMHRRDSPHDSSWDVTMAFEALRVDAGQAGVWALDKSGRVFYRQGTYGDAGSAGTTWVAVSGPATSLTSVSSGKNVAVVVDNAGRIWMRTGLGPDTPGGLAWTRLTGHLKQVEVYETDQVLALWGLDFALLGNHVYSMILIK